MKTNKLDVADLGRLHGAWIGLLGPFAQLAVERVQGDAAGLFDEERELVLRASPARQAEFATGRRLARELLLESGMPAHAIGVGAWREPLFPPGVFGSICHAHGLCAVALSRSAPLGIDLELARPLPAELLQEVVAPEERARIDASSLDSMALFCAKECFQKARTPKARRWLEFHAVRAERVERAAGFWRFELRGPADLAPLQVSVAQVDALLIAGGIDRAALKPDAG